MLRRFLTGALTHPLRSDFFQDRYTLLRHDRLGQRRILVTGASSGIGESIVRRLANFHTQLLITARREDRLNALVDEALTLGADRVIAVAGDITDGRHRDALYQTANQEFGGMDILINNAGMGGIGTFATADEARLRQIMEVNFFAPVELTRTFLPSLRESNDGIVVNVGSVLGHCAVPKKSEYCASKFALHGFTDALRMELHAEGIDVLLVSPSTTRSEFFDNALRSQGKAAVNRRAMTPDQVARATLRAMQAGRRETILSLGGKALVYADRFVPSLVSRLLRRFG